MQARRRRSLPGLPAPRSLPGDAASIPRRAAAAWAFALWAATAAAAPSPSTLAQLDCRNLSAQDVAEVLATAPAPRVLALQGSVPLVTMEPFAAFLESMGYPPARLRHPPGGRRSLSSFVDARRFAGEIAWHYERDGVMPILVGHSQGGMVVIKTLHLLAQRERDIPVWNPVTGEAEARTSVIDPRSGHARPVGELRIAFAAALATGSLPRVLLAQWDMLPILRDVPDSVVDFSGFAIPWDPIAGTGPTPAPFKATGVAHVRNVVLPASYGHIGLPNVAHLALDPVTRAWIEDWRPEAAPAPPPEGVDTTNLLVAADLWYSIKRHWCEAARATEPGGGGS
jgi:hypothetical protein